jgi:hypothetical protein
LTTEILCTTQHEVEHFPVERIGLHRFAGPGGFPEQPVQHSTRVDLRRHGLRGGAVTAVVVVPLVQAFLILLPVLGHGGQLE